MNYEVPCLDISIGEFQKIDLFTGQGKGVYLFYPVMIFFFNVVAVLFCKNIYRECIVYVTCRCPDQFRRKAVCDLTGYVIPSTVMPGKDRDHIVPGFIHYYHRRITQLIIYKWRNKSYRNAG